MPPRASIAARWRLAIEENVCGPVSSSSGLSAACSCAASASAASIWESPMCLRGSLGCRVARVLRNAASASRRPAVPRFGRGPRRIARSKRPTAQLSTFASGCFSSASSVTGASPPSAASVTSRANTPGGASASASPPESSTGTFQRASAESTRRASARSGVTSAAVFPGISAASRSATAIANASSSALAASIAATFARAVSACAANSVFANRSCHNSVDAAGRKASEISRSRPCGAGVASDVTAPRAMPMRRSSACMANCA